MPKLSRLVTRMTLVPAADLEPAARECDELIAILVKSIQTAQKTPTNTAVSNKE